MPAGDMGMNGSAGPRASAVVHSAQESEFARASGGQWVDARRPEGSAYDQVMCEGCLFCIDMVPEDAPTFEQLQRRFQHRCPVVLFSQMAGNGSGIVARREAYAFLQSQEWGADEIQELLDSLALPGGAGEVNRDEFVRAFDAVMCEVPTPRRGTPKPLDGKGKFSGAKTIHEAIAAALEQPLYLMQFCGTVVQPKGTAAVEHWHEQAVCHLGLKGSLRVSPSGLLVDVGMSLQGAYADLRAFADAFLSSTSANQSEGAPIPMRLMAPSEPRVLEAKVTRHATKGELVRAHRADVEALAARGIPLAPPYPLSSPAAVSPERGTPLRAPTAPAAQLSVNGGARARAARAPSEPLAWSPPAAGRGAPDGAAAAAGATAAALYDYEAQEEDELSIFAGQVVRVIAEHDDGWVLGQNSQGAFGVVPGNYLRIIPAVAASAAPAATAALLGASTRSGPGAASPPLPASPAGDVRAALDAADEAAAHLDARAQHLAQLLHPARAADPARAAAAGLHVRECSSAASAASAALGAARSALAAPAPVPAPAPAPAHGAEGARARDGARLAGLLSDDSSDSDSGDSAASGARSRRGGAPPRARGSASPAPPGGAPAVARERSGDLSEDSGASADSEGGAGAPRGGAGAGAVPRLRLGEVGAPPAGAGAGGKSFRLYVQLLEARDLPGRAPGTLPSAFACASIFRGAAAPDAGAASAEADAFPVEHSTAPGEDGQGVFVRKVVPQQRSRVFHRGASPTWNQAFVFADAFPAPAALSPELRPGEVLRAPLDGEAVTLLLSVHDAADAPARAGAGAPDAGADEDLIGRAVVPVRLGHPTDHWLKLAPRRGAKARGAPALHVRVAYGSAAGGAAAQGAFLA